VSHDAHAAATRRRAVSPSGAGPDGGGGVKAVDRFLPPRPAQDGHRRHRVPVLIRARSALRSPVSPSFVSTYSPCPHTDGRFP
jgi:hypothetical protein